MITPKQRAFLAAFTTCENIAAADSLEIALPKDRGGCFSLRRCRVEANLSKDPPKASRRLPEGFPKASRTRPPARIVRWRRFHGQVSSPVEPAFLNREKCITACSAGFPLTAAMSACVAPLAISTSVKQGVVNLGALCVALDRWSRDTEFAGYFVGDFGELNLIPRKIPARSSEAAFFLRL